jgi:FtsH-binding integral membrane protein
LSNRDSGLSRRTQQIVLLVALVALFGPQTLVAWAQAIDAPPGPNVSPPQSNLELWTTIVGAVLPPLIAMVIQSHWEKPAQTAVMVVVCLVVGTVTSYLLGYYATTDIVGAVLRTAGAAIVAYNGFWKPSGIAPAIERATSPGPGRG